MGDFIKLINKDKNRCTNTEISTFSVEKTFSKPIKNQLLTPALITILPLNLNARKIMTTLIQSCRKRLTLK